MVARITKKHAPTKARKGPSSSTPVPRTTKTRAGRAAALKAIECESPAEKALREAFRVAIIREKVWRTVRDSHMAPVYPIEYRIRVLADRCRGMNVSMAHHRIVRKVSDFGLPETVDAVRDALVRDARGERWAFADFLPEMNTDVQVDEAEDDEAEEEVEMDLDEDEDAVDGEAGLRMEYDVAGEEAEMSTVMPLGRLELLSQTPAGLTSSSPEPEEAAAEQTPTEIETGELSELSDVSSDEDEDDADEYRETASKKSQSGPTAGPSVRSRSLPHSSPVDCVSSTPAPPPKPAKLTAASSSKAHAASGSSEKENASTSGKRFPNGFDLSGKHPAIRVTTLPDGEQRVTIRIIGSPQPSGSTIYRCCVAGCNGEETQPSLLPRHYWREHSDPTVDGWYCIDRKCGGEAQDPPVTLFGRLSSAIRHAEMQHNARRGTRGDTSGMIGKYLRSKIPFAIAKEDRKEGWKILDPSKYT